VHDSMHSQLRTALPPLSIRTGAQSGSRRPDPQKKTLATLSHTLGTKYIFGSISVDIHSRVFRVVTRMNSRNPRGGTVDTAAVLPEHC